VVAKEAEAPLSTNRGIRGYLSRLQEKIWQQKNTSVTALRLNRGTRLQEYHLRKGKKDKPFPIKGNSSKASSSRE